MLDSGSPHWACLDRPDSMLVCQMGALDGATLPWMRRRLKSSRLKLSIVAGELKLGTFNVNF